MEKITTKHPESKSLDILANNIEKLKEIFPEVISENRVDFEKLQLLLNDAITPKDDLYGLNWWGKNDAIREAMKPSLGTLRPAKEESVNWDTTENIYIEGDNLEVLKLLQKSYNGKVKMIYIDPPYNTGKDFVYKDNFKDNLKNYLTQTGQIDEEGEKQSTNTKDDGRYHSNWLNMMYPRLKLARNLLTDDGVIFISIDDNEVDNLKKICDEIYGENNFIGQIMIVVNPGGRDYNQIAVTHEYLLVYQKSSENELLEIEKEVNFKYFDSIGGYEFRELRNRNPKFHSGNRPNLFYSFYVNPNQIDENGYCQVSIIQNEQYNVDVKPFNSKGEESVWRWGKIKANENIVNDNFDLSQVLAKQKSDGNWNIYEKNRRSTTKVKSIWDETEMRTENGTRTIRQLFGETVFDHPKPIALIERMCKISGDEGIFLDFFSGSSSSAHGILSQNLKDKGDRKFIMVQLPESVPSDSIAKKMGYNNICEIAKDRIKLAIKDLGKNIPHVGFKVFKLDSSNIEAWDTEMPKTAEETQQKIILAEKNIKAGRKENDLLYEFLLKQGHLLTAPIEEKKWGKDTIYNVNQGELFVCLADKITTELYTTIGEWAKEYISSSIVDLKPVLILKDSAFEANDSLKTNTELTICNQYGFAKINTI